MPRQLSIGQARYLIIIFLSCVLIASGLQYPLATQYQWVNVSEIQNGTFKVSNSDFINKHKGLRPVKAEVCVEYTILGKQKSTIVRLR